jgi:tRNA (mo5U34)-methyltransferase
VDLSCYAPFFRRLADAGFQTWTSALARVTEARLRPGSHGDLPRWWSALSALPRPDAALVRLNAACVGAESDAVQGAAHRQALAQALMQLHPWRKGPYCLHGVFLDCEWRSDWKWDRLAGHIQPLEGRAVLDVGCGNGYHCWRMAGAGARVVLGVDPTILFVMQFLAIASLLGDERVGVLPLALEDLPGDMSGFDSVFSMGVLYHRRSPLDHLVTLRRLLRPGGELVLDTLVVEGEGDRVLVPTGRYASMPNVWFIPSPKALEIWLGRCGFSGVRVVDVTVTSMEEQRATEWMRFQSLRDFLDPRDPMRTLEGHPAPRRAVLVAKT